MLVYLSQILGKPTLDRAGDAVADVKDVVIRYTEGTYPPITGLVARRGRREFFVPWAEVVELSERGARLGTYRIDLHPFRRRDGEILLGRDVLDKQLIDVDGRRVVRVNDLQLVPSDDTFRLVGVDISPQAILRRLGPGALVGNLAGEQVLDWSNVEYLASHAPEVRLRVSHERLGRLHPVDIARIVDALSYRQGAEIVEALDDETAAETLEEMPTDRQADIVEHVDEEKAADILEEMGPDEAADLLAEIPRDKAEDLLERMEEEESEEVRELMEYAQDTAGGLMTTDYVAVPASLSVAEAIGHLRGLEERPDFLHYVYVVDDLESRRLLGVASLGDLLLADPQTPLASVMTTDIQVARPDDPALEVARVLSSYNLVALPVVDEDGRLEGVVTVDDLLDLLLPSSWRDRLAAAFR